MNPLGHIVAAASGAVIPDVFLVLFGWRKQWLPETHVLVKCHRFLHSPHGLVFFFVMGAVSHILIDWLTPHNTPPAEEGEL